MKPKTPELMKFKRLCRRLNESTRGVVGLLELLWLGTAANCPQGDVGRLTNEEIAIMCDWSGDPDELISALVDNGWLDRSEKYRLLVHDWSHHAPTFIHGNLRRWGKEFARDDTQGSLPSTIQEDVTSSPPPFLSFPPPPPEPDPEWAEAEAALTDAGLGTAPAVVAGCIERGCQPVDVRRVLSHWRERAPAWGVGGLAHRLGCLRHNQDPADPNLWPPPLEAARQADRTAEREAVAAQAAAEREAGQRRVANRKAELDRLERAHKAAVNELTREEVEAIISKRITNWQRLYRMPASGKASSGTIRYELLSHFDSLTVSR
jgi:hypothetical protein